MEKVDYLIIGGGIAGITVKHFLKNKKTVLLEAEPGRYKIGESIIPEQFRHPEVRKLLPQMEQCPSYSPKFGSTFIDGGSVASFPLPAGALTGAMHITRTEMEQVMIDNWGVTMRQERVVDVDLKKKIVRTDVGEYKVAKQIIDCSGPSMVLSNLLKQTKILWPGCTTWAYWDIEANEPAKFYDAIEKRKWNWLRYNYGQRQVLSDDKHDWNPGGSTILTKIRDGMWTWQIPLYHEKLLSYGIVSRGGPISREEYYEITHANISPNYTLKPRPIDGSGIYNRIYIRNNFVRTADVPATMDYILVSDASCFADPIYSVGTGLAVNKAIEVATVLNESGWSPEICKGYCEHYGEQIKGAVAGFQYWYDGKTIRDDAAAATVQDELLVGNAFQSNITYHYVQSLANSDLSPKLYPADRFTVDWRDPKSDKTVTALTKTACELLGIKKGEAVGSWTFSKAWPASNGLLLAWKGTQKLPALRVLVSKADGGAPVFRTVGGLGLNYYVDTSEQDTLSSVKAEGTRLIDQLVPRMAGASAAWEALVSESIGKA